MKKSEKHEPVVPPVGTPPPIDIPIDQTPAYRELYAAKLAAGLSRDQARQVTLAQLEYNTTVS